MGQNPMKITTFNLSKNSDYNNYDANITATKFSLKTAASYVVLVNSGISVTLEDYMLFRNLLETFVRN